MAIKNFSDYVVVDIETTGLDNSDEILEIGALRVVNHVIIQSFDILCKPSKHIPIEASKINRIYDETVQNCPNIDYCIQSFLGFITDEDVLIGHNISAFDIKYLNRDAQIYANKKINNTVYDTLFMSRREMKFLGSHSLETLSAYYGINYLEAHRALNDCFINYQVYENIINDNFDNNIRYCPQCNAMLKLRLGRYGWFYGCKNYPNCKYTEPL